MATGDINNNVKKLKSILRKMRYKEDIHWDKILTGDAQAYLPIYHYAFTAFSLDLVKQFTEKNFHLYGKTDEKFMAELYRILQHFFNYRPPLTRDQFFTNAFREKKVIMTTEILELLYVEQKTLNLNTAASVVQRNLPHRKIADCPGLPLRPLVVREFEHDNNVTVTPRKTRYLQLKSHSANSNPLLQSEQNQNKIPEISRKISSNLTTRPEGSRLGPPQSIDLNAISCGLVKEVWRSSSRSKCISQPRLELYSATKMVTGDLTNNVKKLKSLLRKINYDELVVWEDIVTGSATPHLSIYHYVFTTFSSILVTLITNCGIHLYGKTDSNFMTAVYKILRDLFDYRPPLTKEQFLSSSFAEKKVIMTCEIIQNASKKHANLLSIQNTQPVSAVGKPITTAKGRENRLRITTTA